MTIRAVTNRVLVMLSEYTQNEISTWCQSLSQKIDAGTLYVEPDCIVTTLNEQVINALCHFVKFRKDLHTVEIHSRFASSAEDCADYLYLSLGKVKLIDKDGSRYIRRLTLNNLQLTDIAMQSIMKVAHQANYKYVGLAGNKFSSHGFEILVSTLISKELQTRFWLDEYTIENSAYIRSHHQVSDVYNVAQIFSYLFTQNLPYDLYKTILNKLFLTLKENNWLRFIKKGSSLDVLLPPESLEQSLEKIIKWIKTHAPECVEFVPEEEIKKIVLADPKALLHFKHLDDNNIEHSKSLVNLNVVKTLKIKNINSNFKTLYKKKHLKPVTPKLISKDANLQPKTAVILDFNKKRISNKFGK